MKPINAIIFLVLLCQVGFAALSGSGTQAAPWQIATIANWNEFASTDTYGDANTDFVILTADLDFNGTLNSLDYVYKGHFNGQGFKMSDGVVAFNSTAGYNAIFPDTDTAGSIRNLILDNITVRGVPHASSTTYCGSVSGENTGGFTISNVHARNCTIQMAHTTAGNCYVGGIAGANHSYIEYCSTSGTIGGSSNNSAAGTNSDWGGIVGRTAGTTGLTTGVKYCVSTMDIAVTDVGITYASVGGIIGGGYDGPTAGLNYVNGCEYYGTITFNATDSSSFKAGGIFGNMVLGSEAETGQGFAMANNYAICTMDLTLSATSNNVGGAFGTIIGGTCDSCFAHVTINYTRGSGADYIGGFAGYIMDWNPAGATSDVDVTNCYATGTITEGGSAAVTAIVAGFVPYARKYLGDCDISTCYAAFTANTGTSVFGFGNTVTAAPDTADNFYNVANATDDLSATSKTTAELIYDSTTHLTNFNFSTTWHNRWGSYPTLIDGMEFLARIKSTVPTPKASDIRNGATYGDVTGTLDSKVLFGGSGLFGN